MASRLTRFVATCRRWHTSLSRNHDADELMPRKGDRVVVAMSGGVDSSVTARLLVEKDYDLSAVFMRNWDTRDESGSDQGCEWERDWEDVQRVCRLLDLPCEMVDLSREYWTRVFEPSLQLWEAGITPNPDIYCNREIKFGALLDRLTAHQARSSLWLATGHYARKSWSQTYPARPMLLRAADRHKDQTYYLSSISEQSLARSFFPVGNMIKTQVRELAHKFKLPTAMREESMGICFVGKKRKFSDFLAQYIPSKSGPIIDLSTGKRIATHSGLWSFTIGQRAKIPGMSHRMFVAIKDIVNNTIFVVHDNDHPALYCNEIRCNDWHWIWVDCSPSRLDDPKGLPLRMQHRHVMSDVPCTLRRATTGEIVIVFDKPQKAVSPGQIAAVWKDDVCLGSGLVSRVL